MPDLARPFDRAQLALRLLALDPAGLGGLWLRARAGPARTAFERSLSGLPLPLTRLHPATGDDALFGGLDLSATLAAGRLVQSRGLLSQPSALIVTMAERVDPHLAAKLGSVLDAGMGHCLIALDEGVDETEAAPPVLTERLAFHVDLSDVAAGDLDLPDAGGQMTGIRAAKVRCDPGVILQIADICDRLGISSARAPIFALHAARAHAALMRRDRVTDDDVNVACTLTLAHRATQIPSTEELEQPPPDRPDPGDDDGSVRPDDDIMPQDLLLAAVAALIPADLLARLAAARSRAARGHGTGDRHKGNRSGRPLPSRAGRWSNGARIDVVATLRAAAPWQTLRPKAASGTCLQIRQSDLRLVRTETRSDRLIIFAVDASGSAALARLAEAKGAVELMLAQAYSRRDHVALIAFRGRDAEVLLPPTRSLVQTRRRLAALPGGGGTPLAAGLRRVMAVADHARGRGMTPTLALLTDGRANVALDGTANRVTAAQDAGFMARLIRQTGLDGIVIDTGTRADADLRQLAVVLGATYLPLPRANAQRLSQAVCAALNG